MLTLGSFFFVIGVLVTIHEAGHFLAARLVGVHVEKFYIGFNLFGYGWKKEINVTEYGIGWLPLGGYVKVSGMVDESLDNEVSMVPKEQQFKSKPLWAKIWILSGGVIMNFLLAACIFTFQFSQNGTYDIDESTQIGGIMDNSPAYDLGLQIDDQITNINDNSVHSWKSMTELIHANPNQKLLLSWKRGNHFFSDSILTISSNRIVEGDISEIGMIGISPLLHNRETNLKESIYLGVSRVFNLIDMMITTIKLLFLGSISINEMAGPIMIAKVAGETATQGIFALLSLMAFLSVNLGLINLFPIPLLDGGHLAFYAIEAVRGRPLGEKAQEYGFRLGLMLVVALFLFVTWNDLVHLKFISFITGLFT